MCRDSLCCKNRGTGQGLKHAYQTHYAPSLAVYLGSTLLPMSAHTLNDIVKPLTESLSETAPLSCDSCSSSCACFAEPVKHCVCKATNHIHNQSNHVLMLFTALNALKSPQVDLHTRNKHIVSTTDAVFASSFLGNSTDLTTGQLGMTLGFSLNCRRKA